MYVAGTDFTPGVTTQLTLPAAPGSVTNMWVFFDAAYQDDTQIQSIVGTTLTFNSAIPVGITKVTVKIGTTVAIGIPGNGTITDSMVAAGSKLSNRLKYIVYAQDFGAVGNWNGVTGTNDTAAIQSALNSFTIAGARSILAVCHIWLIPSRFLKTSASWAIWKILNRPSHRQPKTTTRGARSFV